MLSLLSRCQFQQVFLAPGITVELPMTGHGEMDSPCTSSNNFWKVLWNGGDQNSF
jgi:hypothetical protein